MSTYRKEDYPGIYTQRTIITCVITLSPSIQVTPYRLIHDYMYLFLTGRYHPHRGTLVHIFTCIIFPCNVQVTGHTFMYVCTSMYVLVCMYVVQYRGTVPKYM
jgi:hypothetical protein